MPMNFPDTWGVKKKWPPAFPINNAEEDEVEEEEEIFNTRTGAMKCPRCDEWVNYFNVSQGATEAGQIDAFGEIEWGDVDSDGDLFISCPSCGHEVFNSRSRELVEYYDAR